MPEISSCVCTSLRKASRAVTRAYDQCLADSGMTTTQFSILRNLSREGPMPLSALADLMVLERTSLYRMLAPIERQGWVNIDAADHGPAKIASITPAGTLAMTDAAAAWERVQTDMVGAMGVSGWDALQTQLEQLIASARGRYE